jgi:two-component system, NtrC family, nitrogen regulation sensor histidine kinase GlnL
MNFQAVLAGLPDAVIAVDEALRVVFWNAAAEELTERSARRMEGRVLKEVYPPDASLVRRLSETLAMGLSRSETETHIERPDHRIVPVSIVTAPLFDRGGRVEAAVAVVRDLSRIRQLEAEVRRGETLAAAGRMAVGLAHEIRNPLGAIRGAVQLLGRELGASPLSDYTTVLLTEVDRVNRIIEMLLDLARPVTIRPAPVNLHQLLERVALLTEASARERRVTIVRRYDPSLPPILGDEDRLVQVFHNLVRNAIEAMAADGGELTLATRVSMNPLFGKVDMGSGQRSMVEVQVLDDGSGIPAAARARIFDPFFTTKERGLGLGLAICHQVMEQHHGAIQIDSVEGHGTTVTCFLPIAR